MVRRLLQSSFVLWVAGAVGAAGICLARREHDVSEDSNTLLLGSLAPVPGSEPAPSEPPMVPVSLPGRLPRASRINGAGALVMLAFVVVAGVIAVAVWPDTAGPPRGEPTIGGFAFSVDSPDVHGAVRVLINPDAKVYTGGAPGLMDVAVSLDVPAGKTVRWTLDLGAVSTRIKLDRMAIPSPPPGQRATDLIAAPETYDLPSPIGQVRDYVLVGEVRGPSSAYTQLAGRTFDAGSSDTSFTQIAWSGPLPAIFAGAYVTVSLPSLVAAETASQPVSGFDFGWTPVSLHKFHATEQLALPSDYQTSFSSATVQGFSTWKWSADGSQGIIDANGVGSSVTKLAAIQQQTFLAGLFVGLAASALLGSIQLWLQALAERPERTGRPRQDLTKQSRRAATTTTVVEDS